MRQSKYSQLELGQVLVFLSCFATDQYHFTLFSSREIPLIRS